MNYLLDGNNFNQRCVVHDENEICRTVTGQGHSGVEPKVIGGKNMKQYRIRKLCPEECFILMGLTAEDCRAARAAGVSDSQLYKQAGR